MALSFNCTHCNKTITVNFLKKGEQAKCSHCHSDIIVPEDAHYIKQSIVPLHDDKITKPTAESQGDLDIVFLSKLKGTPRLLRNIVIIGFLQLVTILIIYGNSSTSIEVYGTYVMNAGNKIIRVTPPTGMVYSDDSKMLLFYLTGDSLHKNKPTMLAEIFKMGEFNGLDDFSEYFTQQFGDSLLFNRVQGNNLNIIKISSISEKDTSYVYYRYIKAYPYFIRLSSDLKENSKPSNELLEIFKAVEVTNK
ncbi:MAG: hypothetical protein DWP97_00565 [Calditrichaeota bacterium]|nr:MAG: hypothetical protein DWP97_00565 [Calditrichota bacterium]